MLQAMLPEEIELIAGWTGEKGKMIEAMIKVKFLDKNGDSYVVHDWLDHAGHLAAFKKRAILAAKKRWSKYATSTSTSITKTKPSNTKNKTTNAPILTVPNQYKKNN